MPKVFMQQCARNSSLGDNIINDTLVTRTKLSWSLPAVELCDDIIKESIKVYFDGDGDTIKPHRSTVVPNVS